MCRADRSGLRLHRCVLQYFFIPEAGRQAGRQILRQIGTTSHRAEGNADTYGLDERPSAFSGKVPASGNPLSASAAVRPPKPKPVTTEKRQKSQGTIPASTEASGSLVFKSLLASPPLPGVGKLQPLAFCSRFAERNLRTCYFIQQLVSRLALRLSASLF